VHHGLLPVTNGTASLGFANPPGLLYFYMLPAALSDNPVLAMLLNSFFAVTAVFLTYLFVTRYYGRFAGAVAGLLYAAAPVPLIYSRFIWQPNMMQPFVVLFFLALFHSILSIQPCQHANACIDNTSWNIYLTFLGSHDPHQVSFTSNSLIHRFSTPLSWLATVLLYCVIAGLVTALALSLYWWRK